jgi:hypothetical protein
VHPFLFTKKQWSICVISCFHREVDESCFLLGHYAASSRNSLQTFRDNLSSRVNKGQIGRAETPIRNCNYSLRNNAEYYSSTRSTSLRTALFRAIIQHNNREEHSSLLLPDGSLKSGINILVILDFLRKICRVSVNILFPTPRSEALFLDLT